MRFATITKDLTDQPGRPRPYLTDYEAERADFSWEQAAKRLAGLPGGAVNIVHEAVDRHVEAGLGEKVALRWIGKDDEIRDVTYRHLEVDSCRIANVLTDLGIAQGDRVFLLLPRIPELHVAMLGALRAGMVVAPLFSAFGPEPIAQRLTLGSGRVLVTTPRLFEKKVAGSLDDLPALEHVLLVGEGADALADPRVHDLAKLMAMADVTFPTVATGREDPALLHFTSGTTGTPKGAVHVHGAVLHHYTSARYALDLHPDDVFWCTADPGWVTGTSYGVIAPLTHGVTMIVDEAEFDAERWYRILDEQQVTVWYTAPTAIRMLMKVGAPPLEGRDLSHLRFLASVGEPLNPEAVVWGHETLGLPFHDNWWQTETGGIMIANYAACEIRPGSMGRPLPGIEAGIVHRRDDGGLDVETDVDVEGELALRAGWPSMFRGYLDMEERYAKCFRDGWYLTGDLARRDADGFYWFVGRADDVIKTAGHLIGPFEVESVLIEHPAVAEAGVIGIPDEIAGEVIKAFVTLKAGYEETPELIRELRGHARKALGAAVAPREIEVRDSLPKTRSGKIMRRLLKARELGLPEGDLSTLEGGSS